MTLRATLIVMMVVTVTGTGLWISTAISQDDVLASRKGKHEDSVKKIKELQNERIATLRDLAEVMLLLYRKARVEADRAYDARQRLLKAEIELAENDADRIKLYEKFVTVMKEYEELATAKKMNAQGTHADILAAKAICLEAEIALEQTMAKAAK